MALLILLLTIAVVSTGVHSIERKDYFLCEEKTDGTLLNVKVIGCEGDWLCWLKYGDAPRIEVLFFTSWYNIQDFIIRVTLRTYENRQILKEFIDGRFCSNVYYSNGKFAGCPLNNNTNYVYRSRKFEVYELFPGRNDVVWEFKIKQSGRNIVCFVVPTVISSF